MDFTKFLEKVNCHSQLLLKLNSFQKNQKKELKKQVEHAFLLLKNNRYNYI